MAVKARATVTIIRYRDTDAVTRYYKLQSSTLAKPAKPTARPPAGWAAVEPGYTAGATNSLYTCELVAFSDGSWAYSDVSLSSSYEAAKLAYNEAKAAQDAAGDAAMTATDYIEYTSAGLDVGNKSSGEWTGTRTRMAASAFQVLDADGRVIASYGANEVQIGRAEWDSGETAAISLLGVGRLEAEMSTQKPPLTLSARQLYLLGWAAGVGIGDNLSIDTGAMPSVNGKSVSMDEFEHAVLRKTLYSNASGTTGTATLSESAANFAELEIFCRTNDGDVFSVRVDAPNGKRVALLAARASTNYIYIKTATVTISGTAVSPYSDAYGESQLPSPAMNKIRAVSITKVVGYR